MRNFFNISVYEFFTFFFILVISFFYFLLSPNLVLLTLLVFLFFLISFYLIGAFNKSLDLKIDALKLSFLDLVSSNISILNELKIQLNRNFEILNFTSSLFYFFYLKKLLFKFYYIKFNNTFLNNLLLLNRFYFYLNYLKKGF